MEETSSTVDQVKSLQDENKAIKEELKQTKGELEKLQQQLAQVLTDQDVRHSVLLTELSTLKATLASAPTVPPISINTLTNSEEFTQEASSRVIPAPSKILVEDQKKKDNRLVELRRITREAMKVDDEEAGLRLYKLQKTMIHVVSDLKKFMKEKNEDISKSWKSIDINTQRVAFEMVEREASSLGVPLNMCIGYWGARRLISKSWANALRTTKKHIAPTVDNNPVASTSAAPVIEDIPIVINGNEDVKMTTNENPGEQDDRPEDESRASKKAKHA